MTVIVACVRSCESYWGEVVVTFHPAREGLLFLIHLAIQFDSRQKTHSIVEFVNKMELSMRFITSLSSDLMPRVITELARDLDGCANRWTGWKR